jgi:hypothetical protein
MAARPVHARIFYGKEKDGDRSAAKGALGGS